MKLLMIGGNGYYAGMISAYLSEEFDLTVFDRQNREPSFPCRYIRGDQVYFNLTLYTTLDSVFFAR